MMANLVEGEVDLWGWVWRLEVVGDCDACKGTGLRGGMQWGSSEWPGCDVCAPHLLVVGHPTGRPAQATHPFIGKTTRLVPLRRAVW